MLNNIHFQLGLRWANLCACDMNQLVRVGVTWLGQAELDRLSPVSCTAEFEK